MTSEISQTPSGRRSRRSGEEVRQLILEAARKEFSLHGLKGATTRSVAQSAGVSVQLLYSHFDSKAGLFEAAVVGPFEDFVASYTDVWAESSDGAVDLDAMMRTYIEDVYHLARQHQQLLLAVPFESVGRMHSHGVFDQIEGFCERLVREGRLNFDAPIAVRALLVLVLTMAVHQDLLLPGRDQAEIVRELTDTVLHGLTR